MQMALTMADIEDYLSVDYVNAHATSTPVGDDIEAKVLSDLFANTQSQSQSTTLVSSTKGATGHLLGAAGALEAAVTVQALVDQIVPATLNLETTSTDGWQHVRTAQSHNVQVAMSNSFGFGGTNASLVFKRWNIDV